MTTRIKDLLVMQPRGVGDQPWLAVLPFNEEMIEDGAPGIWSYLVERVKELGTDQGVTLTSDVQWWVGDGRSNEPPFQFPLRYN